MTSHLHLSDPHDTLKMLRETLCAVQTGASGARRGEHSDRIGRIIAEIDRQRPLGTDGKHGDLHTATCGCPGHEWDYGVAAVTTPDAVWPISEEGAHVTAQAEPGAWIVLRRRKIVTSPWERVDQGATDAHRG